MTLGTSIALSQAVRTRLLSFTPATGSTLASLLGTASGAASDGKLYLESAPDGVSYPYGVLRYMNQSQRGDDGRFLRDFLFEVTFYDRPRTGHSSTPDEVVNSLADTAEQALLRWVSSTDPIRSLGTDSRLPINYADAPAPLDRDLRAVRLLFRVRGSPTFLAQYAA